MAKKPKKQKDKSATEPLPPLESLPGGAGDGAPGGEKSPELPGIEGKGVSHLKIPEIVKAVNKYEREKEARCQASPKEIAAKRDLQAALHAHAGELPVNRDGNRYYRHDDGDGPVDYILEEKLKRRAADDGSDED